MKRKLSALILIVLSIFLSDDLFADPMFGKKELITDDWQFILNDSPELPDANQNWLKVDLPHDWSVRGQLSPTLASCTGYLPGGTGWYKKKLKIADELRVKSFMYILKVCTTGVRSTLTDTYWVNVRMVVFLLCMILPLM